LHQGRAIGEEHQGQPRAFRAGELEQTPGFLVDLHVEPLIGDEVPGKEVFDPVRLGRELVAYDADAFERRGVGGLPVVQ
jgi:hypothetical protein